MIVSKWIKTDNDKTTKRNEKSSIEWEKGKPDMETVWMKTQSGYRKGNWGSLAEREHQGKDKEDLHNSGEPTLDCALPTRLNEIKAKGIYPEDKVTIHFTIFAYVNACFYFFALKCINLHEETQMSLSNDKNAKRLKEIRF